MAHFGRQGMVVHSAIIGKVGLLTDATTQRLSERDFPGIEYSVRILDVKQAYGQTLVRVSPVQGNGGAWVRLERIRELHDEPRTDGMAPIPSAQA